MARMTFKLGEDYALKLSKLAAGSEEIAKKAVYAGAAVLADAISRNLDALPTEEFRYLQGGEQFDGVPGQQKEDLQKSFGVTPIKRDAEGFWNAKIGFDGYGSIPTKKYPQGLPNQLLARAIESGSSVRRKHLFVAPAVRANRKNVETAMKKAVDDENKKMMEGV